MTLQFPAGWVQPPGIAQDVLSSIQHHFLQEWQRISQQASEGHLAPVSDRRFAAEAWAASPTHLMMAHLYLLSADAMQRMVDASEAQPDLKERLQFSVMQWIDAMSPANFLATNPDAQRALIDSGGETLRAGLANLMSDLKKVASPRATKPSSRWASTSPPRPGPWSTRTAFFN